MLLGFVFFYSYQHSEDELVDKKSWMGGTKAYTCNAIFFLNNEVSHQYKNYFYHKNKILLDSFGLHPLLLKLTRNAIFWQILF